MPRCCSLGTLALVCTALLGCGRTLSVDDDRGADDSRRDAGTEGSGSSGSSSSGSGTGRPHGGDGDVSVTGDGSSTAGGSGTGRAGSSADDPSTDGSGRPLPGATGSAGASSPSGTGAAGGSAQPPPVGSGGAGALPGGFKGPGAEDILNPQRCATDEPFVLSIDPGGSSGTVEGWLESAPTVVFDESSLPRFGAEFDSTSADDLKVWWSIASVDDKTFWLYTQNVETELAALTVTSPAEIGDATQLSFVGGSDGLTNVGPVQTQQMAVFHHIPTDRYLALQVLDVFGTEDTDRRAECAAIDARWLMAPQGTGDFSGFE